LPFAAIWSGRNKIKLGELLTYRQAIAVLVFVAVLFLHERVFGVSPLPGG
jgi:uncharacterized membrane protein